MTGQIAIALKGQEYHLKYSETIDTIWIDGWYSGAEHDLAEIFNGSLN